MGSKSSWFCTKSNATAGTCDPAFMRIIRLSTIMLDYLWAMGNGHVGYFVFFLLGKWPVLVGCRYLRHVTVRLWGKYFLNVLILYFFLLYLETFITQGRYSDH